VGYYSDDAGIHGFLLDNGNYTTLDVPGSTATFANGINASGQIIGNYTVTSGLFDDLLDVGVFLATPVP
jgi:hypothetical protein